MTDSAALCLSQWSDRARAMHTPTWSAWQEDTAQALAEHQARCAQVAALVQQARFAMLDHDLVVVDARLADLERLFK